MRSLIFCLFASVSADRQAPTSANPTDSSPRRGQVARLDQPAVGVRRISGRHGPDGLLVIKQPCATESWHIWLRQWFNEAN